MTLGRVEWNIAFTQFCSLLSLDVRQLPLYAIGSEPRGFVVLAVMNVQIIETGRQ